VAVGASPTAIGTKRRNQRIFPDFMWMFFAARRSEVPARARALPILRRNLKGEPVFYMFGGFCPGNEGVRCRLGLERGATAEVNGIEAFPAEVEPETHHEAHEGHEVGRRLLFSSRVSRPSR
jgi:hypothetical protein